MLLLLLTSKSWCHFMLIVNTTFPNNSPLQGVYSSIKPPISAHEIVLITLYRLVFSWQSNSVVMAVLFLQISGFFRVDPPPPHSILRACSKVSSPGLLVVHRVRDYYSDRGRSRWVRYTKFPSSSSFFNSVIQSCPTIMAVRSRIRIPPLFNLFHIN